jgi:hypothetical protein
MRNITRHTGTLDIINRLPSSANGNPRFLLKVDGWTCRTSVDCQLGYSVQNYDGKQVEATIGTHYGKPTLMALQTKGIDL